MILKPSKISQSHKWAMFDFDGTLVRPKNSQFPKDASDWEWWSPRVPDVVRSWSAKKYRILIITDQTKEWKLDMIRDVIDKLQVPATVVVGGLQGMPKKPDTTQFQTLVPKKGLHMKLSFYVGDAAGRPGDWADVDAAFAKAIGVRFYTPEEMFLPKKMTFVPSKTPEIIVMIGYPASGKSTWVKTHLEPKGYYRIEGDRYKTPEAMIKAAEEKRRESAVSIVMDATNGTRKRRELFLEYAKKINYGLRCVWVQTPIEVALERARLRAEEGGTKIPPIALYRYRKTFEPPTEEECGNNAIVSL